MYQVLSPRCTVAIWMYCIFMPFPNALGYRNFIITSRICPFCYNFEVVITGQLPNLKKNKNKKFRKLKWILLSVIFYIRKKSFEFVNVSSIELDWFDFGRKFINLTGPRRVRTDWMAFSDDLDLFGHLIVKLGHVRVSNVILEISSPEQFFFRIQFSVIFEALPPFKWRNAFLFLIFNF